MSSELPRPRVIGGAIGAASSPFALDPLPAQVATATNVLSEQRGEKVMSLEVMRKNAKKRSRQGGRSESFGSLHPFPFTLYRPKWRQPLTCSANSECLPAVAGRKANSNISRYSATTIRPAQTPPRSSVIVKKYMPPARPWRWNTNSLPWNAVERMIRPDRSVNSN